MPTRSKKICSRCSMSPIFLKSRKGVFHVWENRTYQFWEQWDKSAIGKYLWSVLYSWFSALWVSQTEVPNNYFSSQLPHCNNYDGQITDYWQKIKSWTTAEQQKKKQLFTKERKKHKTDTNCHTVARAYRGLPQFLVRVRHNSSSGWMLPWHGCVVLSLALFLFGWVWRRWTVDKQRQ